MSRDDVPVELSVSPVSPGICLNVLDTSIILAIERDPKGLHVVAKYVDSIIIVTGNQVSISRTRAGYKVLCTRSQLNFCQKGR